MIYVASPYSDPLDYVRQKRFELVRAYTIERIKQGATAFSPIMYLHTAAIEHSLPTDAQFWMRFNNSIMRHCHTVEVLALPGWEQSRGVAAEIQLAEHLHIPVYKVML